MKRYRPWLFIFLATGCIDPINLPTIGNGGTLVVDGLITDQPGPYIVRLSRSIVYDNSRPQKVYSVPEKKAKVSIVDDTGYSEILTEPSPGIYLTGAIKGQIGRSYQLLIETANGHTYRSSSEVIKPVPMVDQIQYEYQITETLSTNPAGSTTVDKEQSFAVFALVTNPSDKGNYYRWQVDGIFEYFADNDAPSDPKWNHCWAPLSRLESGLIIASDLYTGGKQFRQYLANIPYERPTYFLVKVRQQSLTESAYHFWEKVRVQQTSTGTLFDPPASPIAGNLTADQGDEAVLGYFGASSIAASSLLINRIAAANFQSPSYYKVPLPGDCLKHEPNATNVKPDGF